MTIVAGAGTARHQRLLIIAVVLGLIGMHHLVHPHPVHTTPDTMASATHAGHPHPGLAAVNPVDAQGH
ncbi:MAG: hypothetical protein ACRDRA_21455 [Pseudonocardiaceae bacterium]